MRIQSLAALACAGLFAATAHAQTEIRWWHSMGGALGEQLNALAGKFNDSQKEYKVVPVFKGTYPESMTAAIAAFRAGDAPHILQVFEVGTATMMDSRESVSDVTPIGHRRTGGLIKPTSSRPLSRSSTCWLISSSCRRSSTFGLVLRLVPGATPK